MSCDLGVLYFRTSVLFIDLGIVKCAFRDEWGSVVNSYLKKFYLLPSQPPRCCF